MAQLGKITAKLVADTREFSAKMNKASTDVSKMSDSAEKSTSKVGVAMSAIGSAAVVAGTAVVSAFTLITKTGIGVAGQLESAEQGFKALLGSADEAGKVMERIKKEAILTPFELTGLTKGVQALTAITKDGDRAIDILLDVGKAVSISGKGSAELDSVIFNLQQIAASGKVTAMDIRQFQTAVPIFNDIIAANGLTVNKIQASENAAELLFEAFQKAGAEGGVAAEGFSSQAGTWIQLVSNMKDSWEVFTADFVEKTGLFDIAKKVIEKITSFIENDMTPAIVTVKEWFEKTWATIKEYWDLYGQPVFDMIVEFIEVTLVPAWEYLKEQIVNSMEDAGVSMEDVKKFVLILAVAIGGTLVGAVLAFIAALSGLMFVFGKVIDWSSKMRNAIIDKFNEIKRNIQWHIDKIKGIFNARSFKDGLLNAMKYPFKAFWHWITGVFENIKKKIQDALDLTKRHSPSVIDVLSSGVDLAEKEIEKLNGMTISPISTVSPSLAGVSGGGISLSINMAGANISSPEIAEDYAEKMGDVIISKLRTNRRGYV